MGPCLQECGGTNESTFVDALHCDDDDPDRMSMRGLNKLYLPSAGASNQCGALTATQGHTQFGFDHVWGLTIFVAVAVIAAVLLSCCLSYRPTLRKELSHLKLKEMIQLSSLKVVKVE